MIPALFLLLERIHFHRLPAHKIHCSVLAEEAVKLAVKDYYDKNGIEYNKGEYDIHKDEE